KTTLILQHLCCLRHARVAVNPFEIISSFVLVGLNRFKEKRPSSNAYIQKCRLPMVVADIVPLNVKRAALIKATQQPKYEIDILDESAAQLRDSFRIWINPHEADHGVEHASFPARRVEVRVRLKPQSHQGSARFLVPIFESLGKHFQHVQCFIVILLSSFLQLELLL